MSKKTPRLTAVVLAAALALASTAEAGPLFAGAAGNEASPWSLAWEWLAGVWADLTGLDSTALSTTVPGGPSTVPPSTSDTDPEYGCGIDPNGRPLC